MRETPISQKYKAGDGQQSYIDLQNELGVNGGGNIVEALKVMGDQALHISEMLEREMGIDVNMSAPNASARTSDKRVDISDPNGGHVAAVASKTTSWASKVR